MTESTASNPSPHPPISLPGLRVGHATHSERPTGCTVWLWPDGTTGSVDVRGAAPGTRETDALQPHNTVSEVHGLCLSGGSAFGLDAATQAKPMHFAHGVVGLAWAVVNAVGDVWHPQRGVCLAGARQSPDSLSLVDVWQSASGDARPHHAWLGGNTTLGVVATNQTLTKSQAQRLAMSAHNGLAQSIKPVHTPYDGDTVFAFSTGTLDGEPDALRLGVMAAQALSLAVVDAVCSATGLRLANRWWPAARDLNTH